MDVSVYDEDWALDLGDGHYLWWSIWAPDPELNPWAADLPGPEDEPIGALIRHPKGPHPSGAYAQYSWYVGGVSFDTPRGRAFADRHPRPMWHVESLAPLTISPSVLCSCGDHGFIRDGRWLRA